MNLRESMGIALAALRANKLRSFLTLLGTIIGVGAVIFVLSVVEGLNRYVSDKMLGVGSNVLWVDKFGAAMTQDDYLDALQRPDITLDDIDALRAGVPHASLVVAAGDAVVPVRHRDKLARSVRVAGRGPGYEVVEDLASTYEDPQEVVDFYYASKERLASVEAMALEGHVVDWVMTQVRVEDEPMSFQELMGPAAA